MEYPAALLRAASRAKRVQDYVYVVWDGDSYEVAREWELGTIYAGARIVVTFAPDGSREWDYGYSF